MERVPLSGLNIQCFYTSSTNNCTSIQIAHYPKTNRTAIFLNNEAFLYNHISIGDCVPMMWTDH